MSWKYDGATITEAKYNGTAITKGKYNGVEFFGQTPGGLVYQKFVDSGMASCAHGMIQPGLSEHTNRIMWRPNDAPTTGTLIDSHVPATFPAMPTVLQWRTSGGHIGRFTNGGMAGTVNPATWAHAASRFWYLCTINTHGTGDDAEHEWIAVALGNTTAASRVGGSGWINVYEGISPANQNNNDDRANVREDLTAGRLNGSDRTASNATAQAYRAWIGDHVRLESGDNPVEFVVAFSTIDTIDPNAA